MQVILRPFGRLRTGEAQDDNPKEGIGWLSTILLFLYI
jgi:hypothetical protein